ncbi:MAG: hypothetical protein WAW41_00475 [Methylobacter sp.]
MPEIEEKKISTLVQFSLSMQIAGCALRLTGGNTDVKAEQVYTGTLLSSGAPFSLKHFANHILSDLTLPAVPTDFPDISINTLSAAITCPPHGSTSKGSGSFTFQGSSTLLFLRDIIISGQLVLAGGTCAAGFDISNDLSTAQLLEDLFGCTVPPGLHEFLPTFSPPKSPPEPIRLYYASAALSATLANESVNFRKGLNLDQCNVEILNHTFAINLQVQGADDFCIGASAGLIDLGILQISSPGTGTTVLPNPAQGGPVVQVQKQKAANLSIDLKAQLIFFPGNDSISLDLSAEYTTITDSQKGFIGTVTYDGSILGMSNPTLKIEWSKSGGLKIRDFPFPDSTDILDFAKQIKTIANASSGSCGQLADFAFKHTVTTRFKLHIKPSTDKGDPCLNIDGTYTVFVLGQNICEINFASISATIPQGSIPKNFDDLGRSLSEILSVNARALVQDLWNDKTALTEFLGVQALEQASKTVTANLICHLGGQDAAKATIENTIAKLIPTPPVGPVPLAAAAAASAAAAATLGFLEQIKCLTGDQKRQRDAALQQQNDANQKIQSLLTINDFTANYAVETNGTLAIKATWSALSQDAFQPGAFLTLTLTDASASEPPRTLRISEISYKVPPPLTAGKSYTLTLCGYYNYQGHIFSGRPVSSTVTITSLSLVSPAVTYDAAKNTVTATWGIQKTPANDTSVYVDHYTVALWDSTTDTQVEVMSATVPGDTTSLCHTFSLLPSAEPYFTPVAGNSYQIRLQAVANLPVFNSEWDSPPLHVDVGIGHTLIGWSFAVG